MGDDNTENKEVNPPLPPPAIPEPLPPVVVSRIDFLQMENYTLKYQKFQNEYQQFLFQKQQELHALQKELGTFAAAFDKKYGVNLNERIVHPDGRVFDLQGNLIRVIKIEE